MALLPSCDTPVALFIYNRPEFAAQVMDVIARARPPRLLVVADGPSPQRADDARRCALARDAVESRCWGAPVSRHYADSNLGCRARLSSGLDWVFAQVPEAIILEDDCLPDASFFPYCSELLARYRDDPRIHMIRGGNFLRGRHGADSYHFSRFFHIWGWASWARAWRHYDVAMPDWPQLRDSGWLEQHLPRAEMVPVVRELFDQTFDGRMPTWEFQWQLASWLKQALAIAPAINLVTNIGFGEGATHAHDAAHRYAALPRSAMEFPLRHPPAVAIDEAADLREWRFAFPGTLKENRWRRWLSRLAGTNGNDRRP